MEQITGLHHIGIYTDDLGKSVLFYETILGFHTLFVTGDGCIAMLERNGLKIELVTEEGSFGRAAACQNHLALQCSDINACAAALAEQGIACENGGPLRLDGFGSPPTDITILFFRGPSGERIELYQPHT
ncbi:VOC family protein [Butyricicoccus sp. 1XD8-22]|nr:VOC family protein [Butyricicoccus sp. 1XD8-22]